MIKLQFHSMNQHTIDQSSSINLTAVQIRSQSDITNALIIMTSTGVYPPANTCDVDLKEKHML